MGKHIWHRVSCRLLFTLIERGSTGPIFLEPFHSVQLTTESIGILSSVKVELVESLNKNFSVSKEKIWFLME